MILHRDVNAFLMPHHIAQATTELKIQRRRVPQGTRLLLLGVAE
jgi:hypothetical protein